ncbi:helix-turn-helix transcriptional regulator [Eubacterium callanderi]|uniref:winged helix-turn-helix transcriptional regulator n=1 Tax=Eubacterium callanderi TaxID=53442 RepID=UPI001C2D732E|nr:helix-turn-helix domain-containing protein [Eubacterium callanderi]MBV1684117.1 helix-turn-helix transcriptional regulator [Eubacterium callanderi]
MQEPNFDKYVKKLTELCTSPDCPACRSVLLFKGKWNIEVLFVLLQHSTMRFGDFKKAIPNITNTMLTTTLRELEKLGVIKRTQYNEIPPRVEYALTESGWALLPGFYQIALWGSKYMAT